MELAAEWAASSSAARSGKLRAACYQPRMEELGEANLKGLVMGEGLCGGASAKERDSRCGSGT